MQIKETVRQECALDAKYEKNNFHVESQQAKIGRNALYPGA
jgi:hypothetical protein